MNLTVLFFGAVALWLLGQINDFIHAFRNRQHTPKWYWLSAGAHFLSGTFFFGYVYLTFNVINQIFIAILTR